VLQRKRLWLLALRGALLVVALVLFAQVFGAADTDNIGRLLCGVGAGGVGLLLVPQLAALLLETLGWKLTFRAGGTKVRFAPLLRVRIASEALAQSLPLGVAFAESVKPVLLGRHCGVSVERSLAGMTARKVLILVAQSAYVIGLAALGFAGLEGASRAGLGVPHLGWLALGSGTLLGIGGIASALLLRKSSIACGAFALLRRLPASRLRTSILLRERAFASTDGAVSALFESPARELCLPTLLYLGSWLVEACETWLILSLLGAHPSFVTAGSIEVLVSLVRNVMFIVPAGLGVQDLGYAACFAAFGIPEAVSTSAAFAVMKRGKELMWIACGYALLGGDLGTLLRGRGTAKQQGLRLRPARA
jgi:uncharacterized membrane protein YbhN (UPF0104 family)